MSIFDKTRYLRAIFVLLPIGIMLSYWGTEGLTKSVDSLPYSKGKIKKFYMGMKYYETCNCNIETLIIYLDHKKKPYITKIKNYINILYPKLQKGDNIEIWTWDKTNDNRIVQVELNGELVLPYDKTIGLYIAFLIVGLGLVVLCIFYVLNSSEDLFGKKNYDDKES